MPFTFNHLVTIKHLNIRKLGNDDDHVLAVDIKCHADGVPAQCMAPLFGADNVAQILDAFWQPEHEKERMLKFTGITDIGLWASYDTSHQLICGGHKIRVDKVCKFSCVLRSDAMVDLDFTIIVLSPGGVLMQYLAGALLETIELKLLPDAELAL